MALDLSPAKWKLKINDYSRAIGSYPLPYKFAPRFQSRLIKVSATARSTSKGKVKESWRRGGYLAQHQKDNESFNQLIPINQPVVLVLPLLQTSYQLSFKPVPWLPNLRLRIWEYRDKYPQGLGPSGVDENSRQLEEIKAEIQKLPTQVIEQINSPEWNWRDNLPD